LDGWAWWVFLVAGSVLQVIGSHVEASATSVGDERSAYVFYSAGFACWAVSAVFGLVYVLGVAGRLATVGLSATPALTRDPASAGALTARPVGPVSTYSRLNWSSKELHDVQVALTERGIAHCFERGDLVVQASSAQFADRVIAEIVAAPER
jgi:hypothetical protein